MSARTSAQPSLGIRLLKQTNRCLVQSVHSRLHPGFGEGATTMRKSKYTLCLLLGLVVLAAGSAMDDRS